MLIDQVKITVRSRHTALDMTDDPRQILDGFIRHHRRSKQHCHFRDRDPVFVSKDQENQRGRNRHQFHKRRHQQLGTQGTDLVPEISLVCLLEPGKLFLFRVACFDDQDPGKCFVHTGKDFCNIGKSIFVRLPDDTGNDQDRNDTQRESDNQADQDTEIIHLHPRINKSGGTRNDLQRTTCNVSNHIRDGRIDRRRVIRTAADQMPDILSSVKRHALTEQRQVDFIPHIHDNTGTDPAGAIMIDICGKCLERPKKHKTKHID